MNIFKIIYFHFSDCIQALNLKYKLEKLVNQVSEKFIRGCFMPVLRIKARV